jgi:phage tail-like protein
MATRPVDPLVGFQFALTVDGVTGYFTEVSGIGSENAVATHKVVQPDAKEVTLQVPGRVEWGEITFKRGLTNDLQFWDWRELVVSGLTVDARREVTIEMFDRNYVSVVTWTCYNAWPSKLSGPTIASDSNDFAIEELTIVHEGLTRDENLAMIPAKLDAGG